MLYGAQTSVNIKNWLVKINPKYSYKGMKNFIQNFILFCMFITQLKVAVNVSSSGKACFEIYILC